MLGVACGVIAVGTPAGDDTVGAGEVAGGRGIETGGNVGLLCVVKLGIATGVDGFTIGVDMAGNIGSPIDIDTPGRTGTLTDDDNRGS
jgi:hypothetical protein